MKVHIDICLDVDVLEKLREQQLNISGTANQLFKDYLGTAAATADKTKQTVEDELKKAEMTVSQHRTTLARLEREAAEAAQMEQERQAEAAEKAKKCIKCGLECESVRHVKVAAGLVCFNCFYSGTPEQRKTWLGTSK